MAVTPVEQPPRSLAEEARDYIRDKITSGEFPPGTRIKERDISAEIGISRIPVREALQGLSTEGFITLQPRRGAIVTELVPEDLREIFEVREILEMQQVALAIRNGTVAEKKELVRIVEAERAALQAGDTAAVERCNIEFHNKLIELAHNELLESLLEPLRGRLNWLFKQNDGLGDMCDDHYAIAHAVADNDLKTAQELALLHVSHSKRTALSWLFENGTVAEELVAP